MTQYILKSSFGAIDCFTRFVTTASVTRVSTRLLTPPPSCTKQGLSPPTRNIVNAPVCISPHALWFLVWRYPRITLAWTWVRYCHNKLSWFCYFICIALSENEAVQCRFSPIGMAWRSFGQMSILGLIRDWDSGLDVQKEAKHKLK